MRVSPAGHSGHSHAIADDVADFPIRQILRSRQSQVWNFGVQAAANPGFSGAVLAVTTCTSVQEALARLLQNFRSCIPSFYFTPSLPRPCHIAFAATPPHLKLTT